VSASIRDEELMGNSDGEFDDKATMKMGSNAHLLDGQGEFSPNSSVL
jgi:hypothetical protein